MYYTNKFSSDYINKNKKNCETVNEAVLRETIGIKRQLIPK